MKSWAILVFLTFWSVGLSAALAQTPISGQSQGDILKLMSELPPETMTNVEQLAKILQQDLKEGKLTDAQIQEELRSGNLGLKLREINPEIGPLLDDLTQAMKNYPDAEYLQHILDGLADSTP